MTSFWLLTDLSHYMTLCDSEWRHRPYKTELPVNQLTISRPTSRFRPRDIDIRYQHEKSFRTSYNLKNRVFGEFSTKNADLWLFSTVFCNFLVLRETFSRFCWHISEGFGVKENDAVVRFSLSITVLESNFSNPSKKTRPKLLFQKSPICHF